MSVFAGGCLCGAIRYRVEGEPFGSAACHCRDCQRVAAGGSANFLMLRRSDVAFTGAEPREWAKQGDSGRDITRAFCGTCGSPLFVALEALPGAIGITAGSLDDPSVFRPGMELWLGSAPDWHQPQPGVLHFDKGPVQPS
jgi:hypothetical protein